MNVNEINSFFSASLTYPLNFNLRVLGLMTHLRRLSMNKPSNVTKESIIELRDFIKLNSEKILTHIDDEESFFTNFELVIENSIDEKLIKNFFKQLRLIQLDIQ